MCKEFFSTVKSYSEKIKMDSPIRITPKCHPRCHCNVFAYGRKKSVTICCSKCDRPIVTIKVK